MHSSIEHADRLSVFIYVQIKVAATTLKCERERGRQDENTLYIRLLGQQINERNKKFAHMFCIKIFSVCDFERQTKCDRINNYIMIDTAFCFCFCFRWFWLGVLITNACSIVSSNILFVSIYYLEFIELKNIFETISAICHSEFLGCYHSSFIGSTISWLTFFFRSTMRTKK